MDETKTKKDHFYGGYNLEKIIFIPCVRIMSILHYPKMFLYMYMDCHSCEFNSHKDYISFNQ